MWSSTLRRARLDRQRRREAREQGPPASPEPPESPDGGWVDVAEEMAAEMRRGTPNYTLIREWGLVLTARHVLHRAERARWSSRAWRLLVPPSLADTARHEIRSYVLENKSLPVSASEPHHLYHNTTATLAVLAALAYFHTLSNPVSGSRAALALSELGRANSRLIAQGEWWRLVTALTLHADTLHLLANLGFGGVIFVFLCRELGGGLGWLLTVLAGALGNYLNFAVRGLDHVSLGASTAVFGAVGVMASVQAARQWLGRHPGGRELRKVLLPLCAGLLLLGWLGSSGENTDLGAHFWGFAAGVGLGGVAGAVLARLGRPGTWTQRVLGLAAMALVGGAWAWALGV